MGTSEFAGLHSWHSTQDVAHWWGPLAPLATDGSDCGWNIHEMFL